MSRRKSATEDDSLNEGYTSDAPEPDADEVTAQGEVPEKEGYTDAQVEAYQPCATPPVTPPSQAAIAKSLIDKAQADQRPEEPEPEEPEVEVAEDGVYKVLQDCNIKGQSFTTGEAISLEDHELETLKSLGVKIGRADHNPKAA